MSRKVALWIVLLFACTSVANAQQRYSPPSSGGNTTVNSSVNTNTNTNVNNVTYSGNTTISQPTSSPYSHTQPAPYCYIPITDMRPCVTADQWDCLGIAGNQWDGRIKICHFRNGNYWTACVSWLWGTPVCGNSYGEWVCQTPQRDSGFVQCENGQVKWFGAGHIPYFNDDDSDYCGKYGNDRIFRTQCGRMEYCRLPGWTPCGFSNKEVLCTRNSDGKSMLWCRDGSFRSCSGTGRTMCSGLIGGNVGNCAFRWDDWDRNQRCVDPRPETRCVDLDDFQRCIVRVKNPSDGCFLRRCNPDGRNDDFQRCTDWIPKDCYVRCISDDDYIPRCGSNFGHVLARVCDWRGNETGRGLICKR